MKDNAGIQVQAMYLEVASIEVDFMQDFDQQ
jgi:hypothetical protein